MVYFLTSVSKRVCLQTEFNTQSTLWSYMKFMNRCLECFEEYTSHPGNRTELVFVSFIMFLQIVGFGLYHQLIGELPYTSKINLGFVAVDIFPMSRLWDFTLGPLFLFLSWRVMNSPWLCDRDELDYPEFGVTNGLGTTVMFALLLSFPTGALVGAVYAPLAFVVAVPAVFCALFACSFMPYFNKAD